MNLHTKMDLTNINIVISQKRPTKFDLTSYLVGLLC